MEVGERHSFIRPVRVGLLDGARPGAVEDDRNAGGGVVAGVGVEWHAAGDDFLAHDFCGVGA